MPKIHFFTPVHYGPSAKTAEQKAIQDIDNYFHIGGKKAVVVGQAKNGSEKVLFTETKCSATSVLKTLGVALSYLTVVIPASLLIAKAALRSSHTYTYEVSNNKSQEGEAKPQTPPSETHAPVGTPEDQAATVLQKNIRGFLARKPFVSTDLYPGYKQEVAKANGSEAYTMPQASDGKTTVYLPKDMPEVVLKKSGRDQGIKRFHQMQEVRAILEEQKSSHLVIPKAVLCENYLVEERLPINAVYYHNMGLYASDPQLFDEAVREMTRLFSQKRLTDLLDSYVNPLGHIEGVEDLVRYDNLPLYVEEEHGKKVGKIGLIDLEHMKSQPSTNLLELFVKYFPLFKVGALKEISDYYKPTSKALETLARIFPMHLDIIIGEAKKMHMVISRSDLEAAAARGRKFLQVGYTDHVEWLKNKEITAKNVNGSFEVSSQRRQELSLSLKKELLNLNQGNNDYYIRNKRKGEPAKNFFEGNPEEVAKALAPKVVSLLLKNIKTTIEENYNIKAKKLEGKGLTESQMVSLRSCSVDRPKLLEGLRDLVKSKINLKADDKDDSYAITQQLVHFVMQALIKGGELYYYDPAEYTGGYNYCWIRF